MNAINNADLQSNKKYCIWCGNKINPDSKFCTKCGKKQIEEENQLVDWLIKHTKDKLKDDAESSLFNAIKNFLLSHIYGTIMSIAIVTAIGVTVYTSEPYIEKYRASDAPQYIMEALNRNNGTDRQTEYNKQMNQSVHDVCSEYLTLINNVGGNYYDGGIVSVDHLLVPDSMDFGGSYGINKDGRFEANLYRTMNTSLSKTVFDSSDYTMSISKQMYKDGYTVGECEVSQNVVDINSNEIIFSREMIFSCVLIDDTWYIAENKVLSEYENEGFMSSYSIDEDKIISTTVNYINAVYAGSDLSPYIFEIPAYMEYSPAIDSIDLPDKYEKYSDPEVAIENSYEDPYSSITTELKEAGYTVISTNLHVDFTISENQNQYCETSHHIVFVDINGVYKIVDDTISATSLHG